VHGETWRVTSGRPMKQGERARVVDISGLTLTIQWTVSRWPVTC